MNASPWDGFSRAKLRWALSVLAALAALEQGARTWGSHATGLQRDGFKLLSGLAGSPVAMVLGVAGAVAFLGFAARRTLASGLFAVGAMWALIEGQAAVSGPMHHAMHPSIAVFGWIVGTVMARAARDGDEDVLAEAGAVAFVSATYVCAACSKVLNGGALFDDASALRAIAVAQHPVDAGGLAASYVRWVVASPDLALAFGFAAFAVQITAPLLLVGTWPRASSALAIVAFHVNVWLMLPIGYTFSVAVLLAVGLPWPRWLRIARLAGSNPRSVQSTPRQRLVVGVTLALALALALAARGLWGLRFH